MSVKAKTKNKKLKAFVEYAGVFNVFSERETEVEQLMYAVLSKEHVLLRGQAGSAKSQLALQFLGGIQGAKVFKQQFTAFMDESYIFGPQVIDELKKGNIVHNLKNSIVDCDFAFLDEFFNANEETIIACNEILNERSFTRNAQQEKSSLVTAIMTTNQEREHEKKLKPIYDRIMFTSQVLRVEDKTKRMDMYYNALGGKLSVSETFLKEDLEDIHKYISDTPVVFQPEILECFDLLLKEFQEQSNLYISDRRAVKSLWFLKIVALVRGDDEVNITDLEKIKLCWVIGNDAKYASVFDACFVKVKKEYSRIAGELKFVKETEANIKQLEKSITNAIGYKDYKKVLIVVESLLKTTKKVKSTDDSTIEARKDKLVEHLDKLKVTCELELKGWSKESSDEVISDDFEYFKNREATRDPRNKASSSMFESMTGIEDEITNNHSDLSPKIKQDDGNELPYPNKPPKIKLDDKEDQDEDA